MSNERIAAKTERLDHEPELRAFLDVMNASIDNASSDYGARELRNDGRLMVPLNDRNILACRWEMIRPVLPGRFDKLLPFRADERVTVHTRLRHGYARGLINVWVSNIEEPFRSFSLGLRVDPKTGTPDPDTFMNGAGSDCVGETPVDEQDTRSILDVLFAGNTAYENLAGAMSVGDAYTLGILSQPEACKGARPYKVEHGEKIFATDVSANGYELDVNRYVRIEEDGQQRTTTTASLRRDFAPGAHDAAQLYTGFLEQELHIEQDAEDGIVSAKRESRIMLFDDPAITTVNGKETVVACATEHGNDLPLALQAKLYPDDKVTLEDIAFFTKIITQPITADDTYI